MHADAVAFQLAPVHSWQIYRKGDFVMPGRRRLPSEPPLAEIRADYSPREKGYLQCQPAM
jgi:hypothetical protein